MRDRPQPTRVKSSPLPIIALGFVAALGLWLAVGGADPFADLDERPAGPPSAPASGDVRSLFSGDDYPASAQLRNQEGTVQATLTVGPDGRVVDCDIARSSGFDALDRATCRILTKRAKFKPAVDAHGRPTTDRVTTPPIRWQLQG